MKKEYIGVNANKLHDELIANDITPLLVESIENKAYITYEDDVDLMAVQAVIDAHDPTPTPPQPSPEERIEALENAMLDMILGGGV